MSTTSEASTLSTNSYSRTTETQATSTTTSAVTTTSTNAFSSRTTQALSSTSSTVASPTITATKTTTANTELSTVSTAMTSASLQPTFMTEPSRSTESQIPTSTSTQPYPTSATISVATAIPLMTSIVSTLPSATLIPQERNELGAKPGITPLALGMIISSAIILVLILIAFVYTRYTKRSWDEEAMGSDFGFDDKFPKGLSKKVDLPRTSAFASADILRDAPRSPSVIDLRQPFNKRITGFAYRERSFFSLSRISAAPLPKFDYNELDTQPSAIITAPLQAMSRSPSR